MIVSINGGPRSVAPGSTVDDVVAILDSPRRGVAVAVNGEVVPRTAWSTKPLQAGDDVEVITAVQGG
jgi:sulfur carrier protein